eukprot:2709000-Pyramimonas_sp.AAC.1
MSTRRRRRGRRRGRGGWRRQADIQSGRVPREAACISGAIAVAPTAVSYTHLTLPTILLV